MKHNILPWIMIGVSMCAAMAVTAEETALEPGECKVLADERLTAPVTKIAQEFQRRSGVRVTLSFASAAEVNAIVEEGEVDHDAVLCLVARNNNQTTLASLPGATKVAWKHPTGEPVWAAVVGEQKDAPAFVRFLGGPTGHRLWAESPAGFTIVGGRTHAEAIDWVAKHRVAHTYALTAARMLGESGGIREGICIDIGCGTGDLDIELAKRSNLTIIGLDIDAEMKPLFDQRIVAAGLQDRIRFVAGNAEDLPFEDDYADLIVSRGTLTFIPDIGKCLKEVDRVLKPTGVAFLGGRYLYTPQKDKIATEELRKIVVESGVTGAQVIDARGQWVKIVGPDAPQAASRSGLGPHMLVSRFIADYAITKGKCLLVCPNDGNGVQSLQRGFVELTDLAITALYPSEEMVAKAEQRIGAANFTERISCKVGTLDDSLPFEAGSFDLIAGIGPVLIWGDRQKKMREVYRVLRSGGTALLGGKYLGMPDFRKVSSDQLRTSADKTGISSIRVLDDMGQWVEIRKGIQDRGLRD
jgi:ubiquinone/menaquinone biosynthesis C-methylase UbiE